ncbi:MAG: sigma-54-dependent Fis family transcriptional regulator [Bacteroidetes bacterium]|nr:sigma-54-dependent Fis family transcriptional regulator [Bacteroidota bacterium]
MNGTILIVDDEQEIRDSLSIILQDEGYDCVTSENAESALIELEKRNFDLVISDIRMPGMDGIKLLERIIEVAPQTIVVLITAFGSVETAVQALRKGAYDYILKPLDFDEVTIRIRNLLKHNQLIMENKALSKQIDKNFNFNLIIGNSPVMKNIYKMIKRVSKSNTNILITGPTGTGKELVARAIHSSSNRSNKPFIPINCGAVPESLWESEFFGHKKGAFTGAINNYDGAIKSANKGTLFLDEISEIPENMQVKLLRVIQEKEIKPLGSDSFLKVDIRIVAASNRDLKKRIDEGLFREDLYYRLNIIEIEMPLLSERKEDIPLLINHFIEKYNEELFRNIKIVTNEAMNLLINNEWKGNIRELENCIERAVLLSEGDKITVEDLPASLKGLEKIQPTFPDKLLEALGSYEKYHIQQVLKKNNYNRAQTASFLGIDTSTLYRKMQKYSIEVE